MAQSDRARSASSPSIRAASSIRSAAEQEARRRLDKWLQAVVNLPAGGIEGERLMARLLSVEGAPSLPRNRRQDCDRAERAAVSAPKARLLAALAPLFAEFAARREEIPERLSPGAHVRRSPTGHGADAGGGFRGRRRCVRRWRRSWQAQRSVRATCRRRKRCNGRSAARARREQWRNPDSRRPAPRARSRGATRSQSDGGTAPRIFDFGGCVRQLRLASSRRRARRSD